MRIRITHAGIYGADGPIPVGAEFDVQGDVPWWAGRYEVIDGKPGARGERPADRGEKVAVTNPENGGIKAVHHARGKFNVIEGDKVLVTGLVKSEADEFNGMSAEDKAAFIELRKGE